MDYTKPISSVNQQWRSDPRIDARIREFFSQFAFNVNADDTTMYRLLNETLLAGGEDFISSENLNISTQPITSSPDQNTIQLSIIKPKVQEKLPCVIYYHGGGMSKYSCFYENFQTLGRLIASQGLIVIMPEFRNCVQPARPGCDVAKFPGGLNDCVSTVEWVHANQEQLGGNGKIILCGESGGGNLTIATTLRLKQAGKLNFIEGFYVLCPYLAGKFPNEKFPSTFENAGILLDYPIDKDPIIVSKYGAPEEDLHAMKNSFAWPTYCSDDEIRGLPRCAFVVNEFDPLRDEGIDFYNRCHQLGVETSLLTIPGSIHGTGSYFVGVCPDISRAQAARIFHFCNNLPL